MPTFSKANPLTWVVMIVLSPILIPAYFLAKTENAGTPQEERVFRLGSFSVHFEKDQQKDK